MQRLRKRATTSLPKAQTLTLTQQKSLHACAAFANQLVALSTPFVKRVWFYEEWHGEGKWERVKSRPTDCPRISALSLTDERQV
jgi:hypothetical protein